MPSAPANVKEFGQLLVRSKLMSADEVRGLLSHFQSQGKEAENVDSFRKLLVANRYLTEYQTALLMRGHADGFFLGQYKILELLAKGRMAGVYSAQHQSGQVVAIKVLPSSKAKDPEIAARFRREARLITKLDHPNVVRAFQVGEDNGRHYLVMEYMEGETLEEVLEARKNLPPVEAVRIVHQAMIGLQHLHERGMIHRDLKPANIMLVTSTASRNDQDTLDRAVKILDIGLGKSVFEEGVKSHVDDPSQLTAAGALIGTPDYLAPEQARNASTADIRSDIYSLGCVLYHALTGQPPFPDKSVLQTVMRHATEPPRPLSDFIGRTPDGLQNVMNWLMAKDPSQRYATPDRAAQALQLFLRNVPDASKPPAPLAAYVKWLQDSGSSETPALNVPPAAAVPQPANPVPVGKLETAKRSTEQRRPTAPPPPTPTPQAQPSPPSPASSPAPPLSASSASTAGGSPPAWISESLHAKRPANPAPIVEALPISTSPSASRAPMPAPVVEAMPQPARAAAPSSPADFDVELVSVPNPTGKSADEEEEERPLTELARRDVIMLVAGGGLVATAVLMGYGLMRLMRRSPASTQATTPATEPNSGTVKEKDKE